MSRFLDCGLTTEEANERARQRARARCHAGNHDYGPWGDFRYVVLPMQPAIVLPDSSTVCTDVPAPPAYRWRTCIHCGARQRQTWANHEIKNFPRET